LDGAAGATYSTPTDALLSPVFLDAFRWILHAEGGSKLVSDTGGLTKFGISQRSWPTVDIENLTQEQAQRIYLDGYWKPIKGNALPPGLALVVFDAAVNMGVPTAVRLLQTVLRNVTVDGVMGPETVSGAKMFLPRVELVAQYLRLRSSWYRDLAAKSEKHAKYLYGWELRCWRLALEAGLWRSA
jgi:lysozyme family protein